jgi:broad specificity phosphatase PhoE
LILRAYVMRHGSTAISPAPEGWKPIGLSEMGRSQAVHAADFMEQYLRSHPKPTWAVSSDLPRAEQTLAIMAQFIPLKLESPMPELRAYERNAEDAGTYERRTLAALNQILSKPGLPFIVCHRSTTGFLAKHHSMWERNPDYSADALLLEGGILAITDSGVIPLFRAVTSNWENKCQFSDQTSLYNDPLSKSS